MRATRMFVLLAWLATACAWTPAFTQLRVQRPAVAASPVPVMFSGGSTASPKKAFVRKQTVVKKVPARVAGAKKPVARKPVAKKVVKRVVKKAGAKPASEGLSGLAALSALFAPKSVVAKPGARKPPVRKPPVRKPPARSPVAKKPAVKPYVRPKPIVRPKPVVRAAAKPVVRPKPIVRPKPVVRKPVAKPVAKKVLPRGAKIMVNNRYVDARTLKPVAPPKPKAAPRPAARALPAAKPKPRPVLRKATPVRRVAPVRKPTPVRRAAPVRKPFRGKPVADARYASTGWAPAWKSVPALPAASSRRTTSTPVRAKPKLQPVNVYGRRTTTKSAPLATRFTANKGSTLSASRKRPKVLTPLRPGRAPPRRGEVKVRARSGSGLEATPSPPDASRTMPPYTRPGTPSLLSLTYPGQARTEQSSADSAFGTVLYGTSALLLFVSITQKATGLKVITAKAPPTSSGPLDLLLPLGAVGLVVALAFIVLGGPVTEAKPDTTPVPTPTEPAAAPAAEPAAAAPVATAAEVAAADDAPMPMPPPEE